MDIYIHLMVTSHLSPMMEAEILSKTDFHSMTQLSTQKDFTALFIVRASSCVQKIDS
jgi:hypothetical protein